MMVDDVKEISNRCCWCPAPRHRRGALKGVKALGVENVYERHDERILGDGDFVERVLASAEETMEKRHALRSQGFDLGRVASRVSEVLVVKPEEV